MQFDFVFACYLSAVKAAQLADLIADRLQVIS